MLLNEIVDSGQEVDINNLNPQQILQLLHRDCSKAVSDWRVAFPKGLYRGMRNKPDLFRGQVRRDRNPTDSSKVMQQLYDDFFEKRFNVRARSSSLFCYSVDNFTAGYGDPYFIFPKGDYKIIYSENVKDLFSEVQEENAFQDWVFDNYGDDLYYEEQNLSANWRQPTEEMKRWVNQWMDSVNYVAVDHFNGVQNIRSELMLLCDQYYAIVVNDATKRLMRSLLEHN